MLQSLFSIQIPYLEKVLRTIAVYALILLLFRLGGRRSMAQLNTMDFVVMLLLSNVVQNAIIGDDNSLIGGTIGAVTLMVTNQLVDRLATKFPAVRRLLEGTATTVIVGGVPDQQKLRRLGLRAQDIEHAVRMQNGTDVSDVAHGVLETGGQLVLTLKHSQQTATVGDLREITQRLASIEELLGRQATGKG